MPRFTFRLPDIGEGIAEAEVVAWHVKVGDRVEEDQQVADMMTDKATVEMESPVSGTVVELAGEVGDLVPIGSALMVVETDGEVAVEPEPEATVDAAGMAVEPVPVSEAVEEQIEAENPGVEEVVAPSPAVHSAPVAEQPSDAPATMGETDRAVLASPAVRQRAKDLGVDLAQVKADGDRVRHADLDAFLRYGSGQGYHAPHASRAREDVPVKVIGMRRRIAENMAASKRAIPHFTYVDEIDVTALEAMRADLNANRGARPKLTMLPFLIVAICRTLPDFPLLNAHYDDEAGVVTRHGRVHMGMATQTDAGLMVPVLRDAQDKNVWQLASEITRLADAARTGKAKSEQLSGSTITVTSLGPLGGIATTPVINKPEVAIIGPNKIVERPVFLGEDIVRAKLMNLSISCDHRVVDGWDAASYVQAVKKLLETPALLFAA
ncbi:2-oxo acid dehydrogenase subunit E2 [Sphingomonas sp. MG17]|uniref:Dihydrolipoamide acetyltransferase component of pyruvate dehydrogenase complex n=1 Tax=Sphingomonas tagetis TaxID=2949092 RepID=A0A9X2KQT8_9SPHN|nr:dihydrolipoamide acetyltransferase family protein [Sphingomonas tagetis]MCP3732133.1 2-oxo acid dehydrogenase subunit E2 [Sphingomonas tagetis]